MTLAAVSILAMTVSLALTRPKIGRLEVSPPVASSAGAALMLLLGIVSPGLAWNTLGTLGLPILTIVSLMTITLVAERSGLLEVLALRIARAGRGDARRLFAYLFIAGTLTGTVATNDAAILLFTPLVFALIEEVKEEGWTLDNKIPFYFSVLYVGNLVGALVISNPINIIVSSFFGIRFAEYALWMLLPAVASMAVSFVGLRLFFRGLLPETYRVPDPESSGLRRWSLHRLEDPALARLAAGVGGLTLLGFASEGLTGVPTWAVALVGAVTLLAIHTLRGNSGVDVVRHVSWDVIVFVVGIFLVAVGLRNVGLTETLGALIRGLAGEGLAGLSFATGFVAATCSSFLNNHPTAGLMIFVIQDFALAEAPTKLLVYSALIGGDLGPKMLPIGSLAALMWFRMLRARGVELPYSLYVKIGIPVTLAAVLISLVVLNLEWALWSWLRS